MVEECQRHDDDVERGWKRRSVQKLSLCGVINKPKQAFSPQTMGGRHTKSAACLAQGRFWARWGQLSRRSQHVVLVNGTLSEQFRCSRGRDGPHSLVVTSCVSTFSQRENQRFLQLRSLLSSVVPAGPADRRLEVLATYKAHINMAEVMVHQ